MKRLFFITILSGLGTFFAYAQAPGYSDFEPTFFEGSIVTEEFYGPSLEGNLQDNAATRDADVFLPPGYDLYPGNGYPVIYLLHGYNLDYFHFNWIDKLLDTMNLELSEKRIIPMIIVAPSAKTLYDGSFYTNSYVTGNWEDYITQDVIQHFESEYRILDQSESRGLSGFSMGGQGTARIAMKHPSLYHAMCIIEGQLDFEGIMFSGFGLKEACITAAENGEFRADDPIRIRACMAYAVAFAPDSSVKPLMGRLPFTADSVLIDTVWQKWLQYDPLTMLQTYHDSLRKLHGIQIFVADEGTQLPYTDRFLQSLEDHGIEYGYEIYSGEHETRPVLDDMLRFFSEQLVGIVPTIRSISQYYLGNTDVLLAESDMDATLYVIPSSVGQGLDSILTHQVTSEMARANEETEIQLAGLEYGKYRLYAVSNDSLVSNIPEEFCVVPDTAPPVVSIDHVSVEQGDSIAVSTSKDGIICLVRPLPLDPGTFHRASEIMDAHGLVESREVQADQKTWFSTEDLNLKKGSYSIYAFDNYGIVTGPVDVQVTPVGISSNQLPEISLYPNPSNGIVTIRLNRQDIYDISITSINGQLLHSAVMEGTTHQIDLSSFKKGVYLITIRSKDFVTTRKIIKL